MQAVNGSEIDVRLLVKWLGSEGVKAALTTSRRCSIKVLRTIAEDLGCFLTKDLAASSSSRRSSRLPASELTNRSKLSSS